MPKISSCAPCIPPTHTRLRAGETKGTQGPQGPQGSLPWALVTGGGQVGSDRESCVVRGRAVGRGTGGLLGLH